MPDQTKKDTALDSTELTDEQLDEVAGGGISNSLDSNLEADASTDADTSDGIFVFTGGAPGVRTPTRE